VHAVIKTPPTLSRIFVMVAFGLSCFGILLFLWLAFGGSVPLRAQGYRVHVEFPEATQLAQEADVRISGVDVGRVRKKSADRATGLTDAEIELASKYAPLPRDTRAMLRQKTLLGETYIELTPGSGSAPRLPDGGTLPRAQVSPTVELDEIFRAFDERTRRSFQVWLTEQGRAVTGRGQALNAALANLEPFAEDTDQVLEVLRRQSGATRALVRDTGAVVEALTQRRGQLRELISNSNRVFETTAHRNAELADSVRILPTFLRETRTTVSRVSRFAGDTNPLISQLRPAARELSPTLVDLSASAPDLRGLLRDLAPLVRVSRRGLPAVKVTLRQLQDLLTAVPGWTRQVTPIADFLGLYKRELAAFLANDTAATQAVDTSTTPPLHYLRTINPINPEVLAGYPRRLRDNRSNPYTAPGGYEKLASGLDLFGGYLCPTNGPHPPPPTAGPNLSKRLADLIKRFVFADGGAPACRAQSGSYPRLQPLP
jgi:phospholipid/cholesterol/gamma-HCH transport system substrate-binding protein